MKLLCLMFGHQPPVYAKKGWYSPGQEYAKVKVETTDGIRRTHAKVVGECARCKEKFTICRIHLPSIKEIEEHRKWM